MLWLLLVTAFVFAGLLAALWFVLTQPLVWPARSEPAPRADPARLEAHVRALSETFFPRSEQNTENLDRAAAYLRAEFERAGAASVSEQAYDVHGRTYRNVSALFGPETPERVVVGAHYDSAGELPAADDNASGVAGLVELAGLLGQNRSLPMRVELVAYTLEEPPYFRTHFMGSAVHAASLRRAGARVRAMFSLEMIGYFDDRPDSQHFPVGFLRALYPSRGNFISVVGTFGGGLLVRRVKAAMRGASALPVYSINAPRLVPGVDFSDHMNYWNAGYDALMITDTAFYRNPNYHTRADTPDTLDYRRMAAVVEGVYAAVLAVAE